LSLCRRQSGSWQNAFFCVEEKFKKMGFDRVFPPDVDLKQVAELLRQDIKEKFGSSLNGQETKSQNNQNKQQSQSARIDQNNRQEPEGSNQG
jgi:hypothetical protein